jgi:transcriptional regulator with XRE-family HTH domain
MAKTWARLLTPADLGEFVAQLRVVRNLTQRELAEELGVRRQYVNEIETGKHTLHQDRLFALLRLLGARLSIEADIDDRDDDEGHEQRPRDRQVRNAAGGDG